MYRVILIDTAPDARQTWAFLGFELLHVTKTEQIAEAVQDADVVLLAFAPEQLQRQQLGAMRPARTERPIPVLLVADAATPGLATHLRLEGVDGFLDPAWPRDLQLRSLELTIQHVKSGQQLVSIQRSVLRAARKEAKVLHDLTIRDELTGLYNRRHFEDVLRREISRAKRFGRRLALVFVDFDHLKQVNTIYGHRAGSAALEQVGEAIGVTVRACDLPFRFGGDEFVILLPDTGPDGALYCAERVREALTSRTLNFGEAGVSLSASFGVAAFPEDGATADEVLQRADDALFHAKATGRNCVVAAGKDVPPR